MTTTERPVSPAPARRRRMERELAMQLASQEYDRMLDLMRDLRPDEWARPTECTGWDVRAMAGHLVGMTTMSTGLRETLRQDRAARRAGGAPLDALTALQVREHAHLDTASLVERYAQVSTKAARARRRMPSLLRRMPLSGLQDVGSTRERWSIGFLNDVILTRDTWLHRMDISRATGRDPVLTPDHDGALVADVVDEWADRHRHPYRLELTGPAGGVFTSDAEGPTITLDAVDFCRVLSGRVASDPGAARHELLTTAVPF